MRLLLALVVMATAFGCSAEVPAITLPPLPSLPPLVSPSPEATPVESVGSSPAACTADLPRPGEPVDPAKRVAAWGTVKLRMMCRDEVVEFAAYSDGPICATGPGDPMPTDLTVAVSSDGSALQKLSLPKVRLGDWDVTYYDQTTGYELREAVARDFRMSFDIRGQAYDLIPGTDLPAHQRAALTFEDTGSFGEVLVTGTSPGGITVDVQISCSYIDRAARS